MKHSLEALEKEARLALESAVDLGEVRAAEKKYLGRKGLLTAFLRGLRDLPSDQRPQAGKLANQLKQRIESWAEEAVRRLEAKQSQAAAIDVTLPGRRVPLGRLHPVTQVMEDICAIFERLGFDVVEGPEVELDWYNFEALNFPKDHPARDMQDTFFVSHEVVLRTHTSSLQIRTMEKQPPPVRVIAPGKVFRCDSDVTHTPMFHQVEGLVVDKGISFADLKGCLTTLVHQIYDPQTPVRFRPSFFPFTEPSAEVDIGCVICRGKGCRVCAHSGWLEVLGAGMVHPAVFENVGYDPAELTGFAFGLGVERIAMLRYGVDDLRRFFESDVRFLSQF